MQPHPNTTETLAMGQTPVAPTMSQMMRLSVPSDNSDETYVNSSSTWQVLS